MYFVILVRPKQDGSFLWSHDLSRDLQKVDTKWTRFPTGLDGLAFAFRLPTSFYWIRYIICLVYILTHRWGSVWWYRFQKACQLTLILLDCAVIFYFFKRLTYITMTSTFARWRIKLVASRLFAQPFVQTQIKQIIKAVPNGSPAQRSSNAENVSICWRHHV